MVLDCRWDLISGSLTGEVVSHYTTDEHLFHNKLGLDVCPMYEVHPHIPEHCPFRLQPGQISCHLSHILSKSSHPCPHISPPLPPHFYRPTPNHPHLQAPNVQMTPIRQFLICYIHVEMYRIFVDVPKG